MDNDAANIESLGDEFFQRGSSDAEAEAEGISCSSVGERSEIENHSVSSGRQNVKGIANKAPIAIPASKALPSVARKTEAMAGTWLPPAGQDPQSVNKLFNALQVRVWLVGCCIHRMHQIKSMSDLLREGGICLLLISCFYLSGHVECIRG